MWKVTLKGLLANKFRYLLTSVSVVLGVAFVAGTFVLTDTLGKVFDDLFADTTRGVDALVRGREAFETGDITSASQDDNREPVPEELLDELSRVDGVAAAEGTAIGTAIVIGADGEPVQNGQAPSLGVPWGPDETLNQSLRLREGRRPDGPDEVAVDEKTAAEGDLSVGDEVQLVFAQTPPRRMELVGTFSFGETGNLAGATLAAFDLDTTQAVLGREGTWDALQFAAERGVSQEELVSNLRARLDQLGSSGSYEAITGEEYSQEQSDQIKEGLSFFNTFLLVFAFVALFVGAFIIYNTFSITIAQRMRELALLRALGASGSQVLRAVAFEALVVGVFSSLVGLGAGVLLAIGLQGLLAALGIELPSTTPVVGPRTVVWALATGTVVTVVSAISPARRAASVPPIAALKDAALAVRQGNRRYWIGGVLTVLGVALLFVGLFADVSGDDLPGGAATVVGIAAFLVFVGVAMLSPLVARPVAHVLGWPAARVRGVAGQLAQGNAMRNPRRTASTAAALMIGLALVSFIAILGSSAKLSFTRTIDRTLRADFVLSGRQFSPMSTETAGAVREALPDASVVELRFGTAQVDGSTTDVLGAPDDVEDVIDIGLRPGADLSGYARSGVLVYESKAEDLGVGVGDTVVMNFARTGPQDVVVRGLWTEKDGLPFQGDYLLSLAQFEDSFTDQANAYIGIRLAEGTSTAEAREALDAVVEEFPNVQVQDRTEFKQDQLSQLDQFLNLMYAMLVLAVIIALFGIVNTLALSVIERTRELGLLRAVGMTRRQMKQMIRSESVIIAVFGALLGLVLGVFFGIAIVRAIGSDNVTFSLPVVQLVVFVVLAGLAGLFAGVWPARRAARLDVLEAIGAE